MTLCMRKIHNLYSKEVFLQWHTALNWKTEIKCYLKKVPKRIWNIFSIFMIFYFFFAFFISYLLPINNIEGPQLELARTLSWMKYKTIEDYKKMFARLEAFPTQVSTYIICLTKIIAQLKLSLWHFVSYCTSSKYSHNFETMFALSLINL